MSIIVHSKIKQVQNAHHGHHIFPHTCTWKSRKSATRLVLVFYTKKMSSVSSHSSPVSFTSFSNLSLTTPPIHWTMALFTCRFTSWTAAKHATRWFRLGFPQSQWMKLWHDHPQNIRGSKMGEKYNNLLANKMGLVLVFWLVPTWKPTLPWIVSLTFFSSRGSYASALATLTSQRDRVTSAMPLSPREIFWDREALASLDLRSCRGAKRTKH